MASEKESEMTVKQLIDKLQGFPQDWPVAVKVHELGTDAFYEPDPSRDQYHGSQADETRPGLYDGQQVVSL